MSAQLKVLSQANRRKRKSKNDVPMLAKIISYFITTIISLSCILPLMLVVSISFTDEEALMEYGYRLIPAKFGTQAYEYIFRNAQQILRSYGVTISVTASGTCLGLLLMSLFAYVISRKYFPWRKQLSFLAFFTMLFSGGMLSSYIINTNVLHMKDTFAALVLPACMSAMYVLIMRSYMQTAIPDAVVESAKIDGANELACYSIIVLPMALPSIATIALFLTINFWNNWILGFLYIVNNKQMVPIQLLLKRIENEINFLASSSGTLGAGAVDAMQADIPSEAIRMCLVIIVVVPILIAYPFFQKFFVNGITMGAVKG